MAQSDLRRGTTNARETVRRRALALGKTRHDAVVDAVTDAMRRIDREIKANDGLYPGNGGALTFTELTRRAGIGSKTLFGSKYRDGFKKCVVDPWLDKVRTAETSSRIEARKSIAIRVTEWRELYEDLLKSHRKTELDLHEANRLLEDANREVDALRKEMARLLSVAGRTTSGKVVTLRQKATQ